MINMEGTTQETAQVPLFVRFAMIRRAAMIMYPCVVSIRIRLLR